MTTKPRLSIVFATCLVLSASPAPQAQHAAGSPATPMACLEEERQALERGQGFGMALVADRHGFPGPRHILELKTELGLTPEQEAQVRQLFDRMQTQAVAAGKKILDKEVELESLFVSGNPEEAAVRRLLAEIASRRADLRWVHLSAHLAAHELLTPEQLHQYHLHRHSAAEQ